MAFPKDYWRFPTSSHAPSAADWSRLSQEIIAIEERLGLEDQGQGQGLRVAEGINQKAAILRGMTLHLDTKINIYDIPRIKQYGATLLFTLPEPIILHSMTLNLALVASPNIKQDADGKLIVKSILEAPIPQLEQGKSRVIAVSKGPCIIDGEINLAFDLANHKEHCGGSLAVTGAITLFWSKHHG